MNVKIWILYGWFTMLATSGLAQSIHPDILEKPWAAHWISPANISPQGYGVYLFRKTLRLPTRPEQYIIHISADNRYKLYVNGNLASMGPIRGDLQHWHYQTLDISGLLKDGDNLIAAEVWNEGEFRPEAQISLRTGLIIQGNTASEAGINTNETWKTFQQTDYQPISVKMQAYYVAGPGEFIKMNSALRNWRNADFDDSRWAAARLLMPGVPKDVKGGFGTVSGWMLTPATIPEMELKPQRFAQIRRAAGVRIPEGYPAKASALTIPAHSTATLLFDQGELTNAYPVLSFQGGKDASITLHYTEALYSKFPVKGNRNEIEGKVIIGRKDSLIADGSPAQRFTTLQWRTFRYVEVKVLTKDEPLILEDFSSVFTGYPFPYQAHFESDQPELSQIIKVGWHTARLCAVETYMDCPYYEQLQYIGDARIQALISLYNTGDDRLVKQALSQMDQSRQPEGVTLSRHPSYTPQYIPTFSLWYIGMLHDYWKYGNDQAFIKAKLNGVRQILAYFQQYQQPDGSLMGLPYWVFTDWVTASDWNDGVAPKSKDGSSCVVDLQLLWAYQAAAELERELGYEEISRRYVKQAEVLKASVKQKYWEPRRKLFADRMEKDRFSQHSNALAILTGVITGAEAKDLAQRLLQDHNLASASIYFKYYLHQACIRAGLGNEYLQWLGKWRENLSMGLTTWAEMSDINESRSDCHAWGSSPNIELYRTVLGIDSQSPGFSEVKIEPHLGNLKKASGTIPHSQGPITVSYELQESEWQMIIQTSIQGEFIWKGKSYRLKPGSNTFHIKE
ncbi:family 78 glycoside hydrolase catalytic domain [Siphonobacter sp. SORGH_AS_0500]|uniref:family 78 glycoside hydrolase catalytic domain n=1 Tax=Siphonobacter sp. SORGH_AS_0500 TaxID=1864824 RepID=UPI002857A302|nr:family 78 glycoside hydrolase catalytic domain [Siphonobacter sp. SORGH_AS_0500]MDR6197943.1 alpha-L-rhamnosidase [Siphonobacter sp. SORGH_AS_0500]